MNGNDTDAQSRTRESNLFGMALSAFVSFSGCAGEGPASNNDDDSHGSGSREEQMADGGEKARTPDAGVPTGQGQRDAEAQPTDRDQDGFSVADGDCDDFNNTVFPGAPERNYDGIDSDCDEEDAPAMDLVWNGGSEEDQVDALKVLDTDQSGAVSLEEFTRQCEKSAMLVGEARPGIVQLHAACAGNNSCRGMVYQQWNELYEHSCRGVNLCSGWSCVETAPDKQRDGETAFSDGHCNYCHDGKENTFKVQVPPGEDEETYVSEFWTSRSDARLRNIIAFGISGIGPGEQSFTNMPEAHTLLSRAEMDTLIDYLRQMKLKSHPFEYAITPDPIEE